MSSFRWSLQRARLGIALAMFLLVAAQAAALVHAVNHAASGHSAGCDLCVRAGGSGSALAPNGLTAATFVAFSSWVVSPAVIAILPASTVGYRARAPPSAT